MHELSIACEINRIVDQYVSAEQKKLIRSVRMQIGRLQNVLPGSLKFCFEAINSNENSIPPELLIEIVPITFKCNACGSACELDEFSFNCTNCGSADVNILTGNELLVKEIELFDEANMEVPN
jgi:hydrogenase nickel incorporation protein HypA/HybF